MWCVCAVPLRMIGGVGVRAPAGTAATTVRPLAVRAGGVAWLQEHKMHPAQVRV
jgi:hypothetical protein